MKLFGTTKNGQKAHLYTVTSGDYQLTVSDYGATIIELLVPDRDNKVENIVLNYPSLEEYENSTTYFGATIGRYANRIKNGRFTVEGREYQIPPNDNNNALHGGEVGYHNQIWDVSVEEGAIHLSLVDKENYFPGTVEVDLSYLLSEEGKLEIIYQAVTDKVTPINLTNHAYFNLNPTQQKTILSHQLTLNCSHYLPVDEYLIPTTEIKSVEDTKFDFQNPRTIDEGIYDHCMILSSKEKGLKECATLYESTSGRVMRVLTTMEAVQFYSGNFLEPPNQGLCLETQRYIDAINNDSFPTSLVYPDSPYREMTVFEFTTN